MNDARNPPDRIGVENDAMCNALAFDDGVAPFAVEGEAHGENRLKRVALRASRRADVGFARRRPHSVVGERCDRLGRHAAAGEIGDSDVVSGYADLDYGRDARLFGLVERVVDRFLDDDSRPVFYVVAGQLDQFALGGELGQPRGAEGFAREAGRAAPGCGHGDYSVSAGADLRGRPRLRRCGLGSLPGACQCRARWPDGSLSSPLSTRSITSPGTSVLLPGRSNSKKPSFSQRYHVARLKVVAILASAKV